MSTLSESTEVVAADDCLSTTIDDETVILDMGAGKYYGFNEVGTFVWNSVQQPLTVAEICDKVTAEYDVEYERCRSDVDDLLVELADKDLVRFEEE